MEIIREKAILEGNISLFFDHVQQFFHFLRILYFGMKDTPWTWDSFKSDEVIEIIVIDVDGLLQRKHPL